MPKVSVIVPVYNTEKYLKRCLDSLVNQTLSDIEILIVNDGSTDNSQEIINSYKLRFPDKIITYTKPNGGLSDARNYAIPFTNGEYISFIDSDDYIELNMFEEMYNKAKSKDLDLLECNFIWEYPLTNKYDIGKPYTNKEDFFIFGRVMACNKLFKSYIIKNHNIKFPLGLKYEDIEFFYKLIPYIKKCDLINNYFYHYTQRENSIVNNQNNNTSNIFNILNNIIVFYKQNNLYQKYYLELEYLYIRLLLGSSFLRIVKIKNKLIREKLLNKTIDELYFVFPNWKTNKFLKVKNKKNIYYKTVNKFTFKIYSFIFRFI